MSRLRSIVGYVQMFSKMAGTTLERTEQIACKGHAVVMNGFVRLKLTFWGPKLIETYLYNALTKRL